MTRQEDMQQAYEDCTFGNEAPDCVWMSWDIWAWNWCLWTGQPVIEALADLASTIPQLFSDPDDPNDVQFRAACYDWIRDKAIA